MYSPNRSSLLLITPMTKVAGMNILGILAILAGLSLSKGEVDCSRHPPHVNFENCCQIPDFITEDIQTECLNEMNEMFTQMPPERGPPGAPPGGPHHRGPHGGRHHCFMSCLLNKTGILVDGELEEDNLNDYLNEVYDNPEIIDFIDEIFHKCNEKRKNHAMKKPINRHGPFKCPYNNEGMLQRCTFIHAFKECPDSVWSNTDECNDLREHFKQCKPPHHGPNNEDVDVEEDNIDEDQVEEEI